MTERFKTVCADPPWQYRQPGGVTRMPYSGMTIPDLMRLPVADVAEENAHLYLWTTNSFMVEAHQIALAWGFRPITILTWIKTKLGTGYYFRGCTEHVVFAVRGSLGIVRRDLRNYFETPDGAAFVAPSGRHSAKPAAFFDLVEAASPGPYLEVFGRSMARMGWTALGNEVGEGGDIREALERLRLVA